MCVNQLIGPLIVVVVRCLDISKISVVSAKIKESSFKLNYNRQAVEPVVYRTF